MASAAQNDQTRIQATSLSPSKRTMHPLHREMFTKYRRTLEALSERG
jgi:hypothetical protein